MYEGECLCGTVRYKVRESITTLECCHCLTCRKAHSSAFAMGVTIDSSNFKLISGHNQLSEFESSKGKFRVFCKMCGSHIYAYRAGQSSNLRLRSALLNTDLSQFKVDHIYTENRLYL